MRSLLILMSAIFFLSLTTCSSSKKAAPALPTYGSSSPARAKPVVPTLPPLQIFPATKTVAALLARPVTSLGDNHEPKFSPDGSKLLFISSQRSSHKQAQVYEMDLLRGTERRVTFHDGDDEGLSWVSNSRIAYSSTTDEMKEGAYALERLKSIAQSKAPPRDPTLGGEVYIQRLDGREIERLTVSPGPDIAPDVDPTSGGSRIAFASSRAGSSRLFLWGHKGVKQLTDGGDGTDANPAFRIDGKALAFERLDKTGKKSRIFISEDLKTSVPLTSEGFRDMQPVWHPKADGILFASNRGNGTGAKNFDLYFFDRKLACLKRITALENDALDPSFSPDGSKIAFTVSSGGPGALNQIYIMEDRTTILPCQ